MTICHAKQEDEKELVFKFGFVGGFPPYRRGDLWSPDNIKIDIRQHFLYLRATTGRPYGVGYLFDKPQFESRQNRYSQYFLNEKPRRACALRDLSLHVLMELRQL